MSKRDEQIARIQGLMTYGISSAPKKSPVTESVEGPDGKVYAIIREGSKFYIKSATKGSELVAESFDYIGGFMNKKNKFMIVHSKYTKIFKSHDITRQKYNELYEFAVSVRNHKNIVSEYINQNLLHLLEFNKFAFVKEMRHHFKDCISSSFDAQLYTQIFDCYQNKFDAMQKRLRFEHITYLGC